MALGIRNVSCYNFELDRLSLKNGKVAEWSNAPDSKSGIRLYRIVGSNPTPSARFKVNGNQLPVTIPIEAPHSDRAAGLYFGAAFFYNGRCFRYPFVRLS